jgi:hypothetical protein
MSTKPISINKENYFINAESFSIALLQAKVKTCKVINTLIKAVEVPELIMKISKIALAILDQLGVVFSPAIEDAKEALLHTIKEIKNFTKFIKGLKSIDSVLNFKFKSSTLLTTTSGLALLFFSGVKLVDRFKLGDISAIKVAFSACPCLGVLGMGWATAAATLVMSSTLIFLSLDSLARNQFAKSHASGKKSTYTELGDDVIKSKRERIAEKLQNKELSTEKKEKYAAASNKLDALKIDGEIDFDLLEVYLFIKLEKWDLRHQTAQTKVGIDRKTIVKNVTVVGKQILVLGPVLSGYGTVAFPMTLLALDIINVSCSTLNFFAKKQFEKN